jgi:imidazolonepropionase-like amidohydrolase
MRSTFRVLSLVCVTAVFASAQQKSTIFHNATLVDGTGAAARQHVDIWIRKGEIEHIGPAFTKPPKKVEIVDCTGKTIIPGLISAHSHLGILLNNADPSPDAYTAENVTAALNQFERFGVTTIVSLGLNRDLVYDLREQQHDGKLGGATLLTAGRGIGMAGGAPALNVAPDQNYKVATPDEGRKAVDEMASHKVDLIKIWVDSSHGTVPEMSPEIYTSIIDEAHKHHLKVAAHVYTDKDASNLVNSNVDILAHSVRNQTVGPAFTQAMLQHNTWYIPTLALDESFYLYATDPLITQTAFFRQAAGPQLLAKLQASDYIGKTLAAQQTIRAQDDHAVAMKNLKIIYDAGISVAFGTDSGAVTGRIPGFSEHRELEDLVSAGLTPLQAITVATGQTGHLIHALNSHLNVGLIQPDYSADLIILDADPLMDIRNTRRIRAVYHHGALIPNAPPQN